MLVGSCHCDGMSFGERTPKKKRILYVEDEYAVSSLTYLPSTHVTRGNSVLTFLCAEPKSILQDDGAKECSGRLYNAIS